MLFLITNSIDDTSDEIVRRVGESRVFRFNIDLWRDYEIRVDPGGFWLKDPSGRSCSSGQIKAAYVRKPVFNSVIDLPASGSQEAWLRAQISTFTQEIYNWCRDAGLVRLVEKGAQRRFGKFSQLWLAKRHFSVPLWLYAKCSEPIRFGSPAISKPLTAEFVEDFRMLYTTCVEPELLDFHCPWLLQKRIDADADVTVVYVAGKCFSFSLDRRLFEGVDWRKHINNQSLPWQRCALATADEDAIRNYMREAHLDFGRFDFLLEGKTMHFLEVNPNGQWAWLDENGTDGVFDAVVVELTSGWTN